MSSKLYLMLGYPGSGKTTAARLIHDLTGASHIWADHERRKNLKTPTYSHTENTELYDRLNSQALELLEQGKSVVYDTNFSFYKDRLKLKELADKSQAEVVIVWVCTPIELAKSRAINDAHKQETRVLGDMSLSVFSRLSSNIEEPREGEEFIKLDGTKLTKEYVESKLIRRNEEA